MNIMSYSTRLLFMFKVLLNFLASSPLLEMFHTTSLSVRVVFPFKHEAAAIIESLDYMLVLYTFIAQITTLFVTLQRGSNPCRSALTRTISP